MGCIAVVQVQKVRRAVTRFKYREIFLTEIRVAGFAGIKGKEEGEIRVVGIQQVEIAKVKSVISWNRGEEGVEQVKPFVVKLGVMYAENFVELCGGAFDGCKIAVVQDDTQGKLAEVVAVKFNLLKAFAKFPHLRFPGIVEEHILRAGVVQIHLTHEGSLGVVKMAALGLDVAAGLARRFFPPFGHDVIVGGNT